MERSLSPRQQHILAFIASFEERQGWPPTVRDIREAVGLSSTSVVHYNLKRLQRAGLLDHAPRVSRGIKLSGPFAPASRLVSIPVVGRIAAGEPIEAVEEADQEYLRLPGTLAGDFALRVKGKSMVEDYIDDGDLVIVRRQETADEGDIVVALLTGSPSATGEATLKRLYREGEILRLQPANAALPPIYVRPADLKIQGKVVAVLRRL